MSERTQPVGRARRGVVGGSRFAVRLRAEIRQAAADPGQRPVLISGEPGLEKDNLAALIHFGSSRRQACMVSAQGALLRPGGEDLRQALAACPGGSLLICGVDRASEPVRAELRELLEQGSGHANGSSCASVSGPRLLLTAERTLPEFDGCVQLIRVPPLRVRRRDLGDWVRYGLRQQARLQGWPQAPDVAPAVLRLLQGHDFPGNLRELELMLSRALRQAEDQGLPRTSAAATRPCLPEEVFWLPQRRDGLRFDLWRWRPALRGVMRDPRLWRGLLFGLVSWVFVLVNLWLWFGPQDRAHNGALNLFWAWWWPLILLGYPLVGRLWCSFCPFMVWGEISQWLVRRLGWRPAAWPRGNQDAWAAPALATGFAAILLWEHQAALPEVARLSSLLLLLITAGAVLCSLLLEKRWWCRHLCPIGGMNGLFARLSILELRAQAGTCSGTCSSYACFKGGPADGEGLATAGCPLGTHPAHLRDNRNCVLCLTCAQACPHRSVQLRLRPPAADLQPAMEAPPGDSMLLLVLAGSVPLAHASGAGVLLSLGLPLLLGAWIGGVGLPARWAAPGSVRLALFALLPLVWGLMLADHLPMGMAEAGRLLPVSLSPWLPEGALARLPAWQAEPAVIAFCQSGVVLAAALASLLMLRRMLPGRRPLQLAGAGLVLLAALWGRWLVALP
ncbi:4Fe-4S binding protein [Synechococcus sp. RSCCF101]|uniref:4Fe-4S binding protein n=1 Tax=Synechococcus sp. RSCCF101 TaxID=2511069 RepID=UPI00124559B4|nr:4Fe-4S binding protein [Synechococcus sp. RSCCF101]QEY31309.1 4Fe-4S binding protein [Synechococcus sp. RSCCF101]